MKCRMNTERVGYESYAPYPTAPTIPLADMSKAFPAKRGRCSYFDTPSGGIVRLYRTGHTYCTARGKVCHRTHYQAELLKLYPVNFVNKNRLHPYWVVIRCVEFERRGNWEARVLRMLAFGA